MFGWIRRWRRRRVDRLKAEVEAYGDQIRDWARKQEMPELDVDIRPRRPYVPPSRRDGHPGVAVVTEYDGPLLPVEASGVRGVDYGSGGASHGYGHGGGHVSSSHHGHSSDSGYSGSSDSGSSGGGGDSGGGGGGGD